MHVTTRPEGVDNALLRASIETLRQVDTLVRACSPGDAFRQLMTLHDACVRVSDCLELGAGATCGERDVYELARARALILMNKIELMKADVRRVRSHQKSGNAG